MNILTPDLITAAGGLATAILFAWFALHMARMQAIDADKSDERQSADADKLAERQAESQKEFMSFMGGLMESISDMHGKMAEVVLQATAASQEQSRAYQEQSREFSKAVNKNSDVLTSLLRESRTVTRSRNET